MRPHIFRFAQFMSPARSSERFTPVVGDSYHLSLVQLSDSHVPIHSTIAVIRVPLYDDHRYDLAIMSTKGMSVIAARKLIPSNAPFSCVGSSRYPRRGSRLCVGEK